MGTGSSKHLSPREEEKKDDLSAGQLYVSLKLENHCHKDELIIPHVYGSNPLIGSWDLSKSVVMERETTSCWELSFVAPLSKEALNFKFLLKPKHGTSPCIVEDGANRLLTGGNLGGEARLAIFKIGDELLGEYKVFIKVDRVSPFHLAASWGAYQVNLKPWTVHEFPEITINAASQVGVEITTTNSGLVYEADFTESPKSITHSKPDSKTKNALPVAAGAVAAAATAVAGQMLGWKADRHLAIVMVGLPARGKTFIAAKLTRYLRWLGYDTKHFNVGKYRRLKHGTYQAAHFFSADNPESRNELAVKEDMIAWMQEGGQVGVFDATNSTRSRRNMLVKMAEGKCKIIFLETLCTDERIIERNIRLKIQESPDYSEVDLEAGLRDFIIRLANYEKVYEPVEEGSYIKMIDMVVGQGGQIQVNNISGSLPGRIVSFLANTYLNPRPNVG